MHIYIYIYIHSVFDLYRTVKSTGGIISIVSTKKIYNMCIVGIFGIFGNNLLTWRPNKKVGWHHWRHCLIEFPRLTVATCRKMNAWRWWMSFQKHRQGSPKRSKAAESSFRASKCGSFVTWFGAGEFLYLFGIEMVVRDGKPRPCWQHNMPLEVFPRGISALPAFCQWCNNSKFMTSQRTDVSCPILMH